MPKTKKQNKKNFLNKIKPYIYMIIGGLLIASAFILDNFVLKGSITKTVVEEPNKSAVLSAQKNVGDEGDKEVEIINELPVNDRFTSQSYLLYDVNSKEIVGGKNIDTKLANASTTKLMTALVAIEEFPLDKVLQVSETCIGLEGNNVGFNTGESYYVEDLLYGLLLRSASDAACALTSNFPGGTDAFIQGMNNKAKSLELENTQYKNSIGLDQQDHYSTSRDLLDLILYAKEVDKLNIIMASRDFTLRDLSYNNRYLVSNTNRLLFNIPGTVGYKTGYTSNAGECLIFGYNNFGTELIIVIMASQDRFFDAKHLLDLYLQKSNPIEEAGTVEATSSVRSTEELIDL